MNVILINSRDSRDDYEEEIVTSIDCDYSGITSFGIVLEIAHTYPLKRTRDRTVID